MKKNPKFKVGDHVRISKYRNTFAKGYAPNFSEEIFVVKKVKKYCTLDLCSSTYVVIGNFYEKEPQKTNQKEFRIEKVVKRKGNKLYVKWKGYNIFLIAGLIKRIL